MASLLFQKIITTIIAAESGDYKRDYLIYLTPFVPLSFKREGEGYEKRGCVPLRHPRKKLDLG